MNITFKNGEKIFSITMEDASFRMLFSGADIMNILNNEVFEKGLELEKEEINQAKPQASVQETKEAETLNKDIWEEIMKVRTAEKEAPEKSVLKTPVLKTFGYSYPSGLSEEQIADLTALSSDPAALKRSGRKIVRGGKKVSSYSVYEISFLKSMQEACIPTETIYDEFIKNPFCAEHSLAAVRTRLSILKHS